MLTTRHVATLVASALAVTAVTACAQLQGLGGYEKIDCLDDCVDSGVLPATPDVPPTSLPDSSVADAAKTCPPCAGATPVCNPTTLQCVACLPGVKECDSGQFCDPHPTLGYKCATGCATTSDCLAVDGGSGESGSVDEGAPASPIVCCANRCVDTMADAQHCGGCGVACAGASKHVPDATCTAGTCTGACATGYTDCNSDKLADGCEVNTSAGPDDCGGCGTVCSSNNIANRTCGDGTCNGTCAAGFADCNADKQSDGCEMNVADDIAHCGTCTTTCSSNHVPAPSCGASKCNGACEAGWTDCNLDKAADGCETNLKNDTAHCNACNAACATPGQRRCENGACKAGYGVTSSPQPFVDACGLAGMSRYLNFGHDDDYGPLLTLPFTFTFFGVAQTKYWVTSNGSLGFGSIQDPVVRAQCPLPDAKYGIPVIMGFNDDLQSRNGPDFGVCVGTMGAAPNRKVVATWQQAQFFHNPGGTLTFSIVLSETTNTVDVTFKELSGPGGIRGESAAVGVQSFGQPGTAFNCSEGFLTSSTRVRFIP